MKIPVVCYGENKVCGKVIGWIESPTDGLLQSRGLCPECYKLAEQRVNEVLERLANWQFDDSVSEQE